MRTTALYARRSKKGKDGEADTVDSQVAELEAYARARGWRAEVFSERGASAGPVADQRRKVFYGDLVPRIQAGEVERVLVAEVDRLSRYQLAFHTFLALCRANDVEVIVTRTNTILTDPETSILEIAIRSGLASEENRIRSRRQSSLRQRKRDAGVPRLGGTRKYGYEADNVTLRPSEVTLIRESARRVAAGESLHAVTVSWWDAGVLSAKGTRPRSTSVKRVLQYSDLIEPAMRERVRAIFAAREGGTGWNRRTYLLGGLVFCDQCHGRLITDRGYYGCRTSAAVGVKGCGSVRRRADELEQEVLRMLIDWNVPQEEFEAAFEAAGTPERLADVAAAERAKLLSRREEVAASYVDGSLSKDLADAADKRITAELERLDDEGRDQVQAEDPGRMLREWKAHDPSKVRTDRAVFDWWRRMLETVLEHVEVPQEGPPSLGLKW